jgi:FlaA1/EpsC-like NDP-sugar epimerase
MSYLRRRTFSRDALVLMVVDAVSVVLSFWLALAFRFDGLIPRADQRLFALSIPVILTAFVAANLIFGLYQHVWRFTSPRAVLTIGLASLLVTIALIAADLVWSAGRPVPISVVGLGGVLACGMFTMARYRQRLLTGMMGHLQQLVGSPDRQRVLIVGAGAAGHFLARQIEAAATDHRYELVGFVDDDPRKLNRHFTSAWVLGNRNAIPTLVAEREVDLIIIAIHQISGPLLRDLLSICLATRARVKILPDFLGAIERANGVLPLRDITAEDLLGRQVCEVDQQACRDLVAGKVVLVTGAAGSIGSELSRQVQSLGPARLLLVDNNETGLHDLTLALPAAAPGQLLPIVADVTNQPRIEAIFAEHRPQVVFHVAAYKHVPMMEHHPDEAVRVNVLGTAAMAELAAHYAVERFVFISTDKAVNPSSVMGATKRVGELLMMHHAEQAAERGGGTLFTAVRFGNVLGSRGSVAPTFVRQIEQGGPVTITHPEMTRFFISISEAVSLVIQAATLTSGGDIFMLDMGQAIRIEDLAHKMIRLRGLRPGADIPIVYTGVRPGEKLHEELHTADEAQLPTPHARIFRIQAAFDVRAANLTERVGELIELAYRQRVGELTDALWRLARHEQVLESGPLALPAPAEAPAELEREFGGAVRYGRS